ncbi:P-loop containing nucleoside triphosphate hydrolase protein [Piedraia hortae CBS 480.64]|uniref:ATP-dependent DNA helicase n=1 Tax=Piedraia hortae CBS 480.64 TaxID=1314780 RepID=A0A6A7BSL8_9PEZI|nr:P-loop containing nucleoside triphosphate hydrolase protein [Piedraia hortae CBS 480.64]
MTASDEDYGFDDDDTEFLIAAAEAEAAHNVGGLTRPAKRPRQDNDEQKQSRHKIRTLASVEPFPITVYSQTQHGLDATPARLRGPIWKRPRLAEPEAVQTEAVQTASIDEDARLAARLQAEGNHGRDPDQTALLEELAELPLDTSSPERPPVRQPPPRLRAPQGGLRQTTLFGDLTEEVSDDETERRHAWPLKETEEPPTHHKLNAEAMKTWIYPTNLGTIRDYQFSIVSRSLYHNTLVALPTGLGKTFIAATIMLNYYRWTTDAQIVFMAPTKPLIAQQMEACYNIVGIRRHDTVLMTGATSPGVRADEWRERRVFFMTPQTVINDLKTGICDPKRIVLLVVDEAHKATGGYAYTEVVSFLRRFNNSFRVVALTATPGSTVEAVQAVVDNLGIARVELRTEQSIDIRPYTHEKEMETELFDYSEEQDLIMEHMSKALKPQLDKLTTQNAYWSRDPMSLTAFGLTKARQQWSRSDAGRKAPQPVKVMVNVVFTVLSQLAHAISLLKNHGIAPFYTSVLSFKTSFDQSKSKSKTTQSIIQNEHFSQMMTRVRGWINNPDFIGHPKLHYLRSVVLNHFLDASEGVSEGGSSSRTTRVMIFASFRDSTEEIVRILAKNHPLIRPHVFVGQASSSNSDGMSQRKQNEVIQAFKSGKYNTLVATSIGEEGLDIGDVDLIVCYDASSSPIRMLQRIGRTGRKRVGRVVLLLMKGKENSDYEKAKDSYAFIQKTIADEGRYTFHRDQSPRIVPRGVNPVVVKEVIEIPIENSQPIDLSERRGRKKRPPKRFHMPDNVITGFVSAGKLGRDGNAVRGVSPVSVPELDGVLLTPEQDVELEEKYARTAGDEDLVIQPPDGRNAAALRELGPTGFVGHGDKAVGFSRAMRELLDVDAGIIRVRQGGVDERLLYCEGGAGERVVEPEGVMALRGEDAQKKKKKRVSAAKAGMEANDKTNSALKTKSNKTNTKAKTKHTTDIKGKTKTKPKGRGRKKTNGDEAAEGSDSEPAPTPSYLKLASQGIDLGEEDTSGEDDDEMQGNLTGFVIDDDEDTPEEGISSDDEPVSKRDRRVVYSSDEDR